MRVRRVSQGTVDVLDPASALWSEGELVRIDLIPTPLALQPSPYVKASREDRPYGRVREVDVRALHDGKQIAFLLTWDDPDRDVEPPGDERFPDGAALLFPLAKDAPLVTMGAEGKPVGAWHWRADRPDRPRSNVAAGLGTTRVTNEPSLATASHWDHGRWRVVFRRALSNGAPPAEAVQMKLGDSVPVAFAVWDGSNGERGGLKSFSPSWLTITLED